MTTTNAAFPTALEIALMNSNDNAVPYEMVNDLLNVFNEQLFDDKTGDSSLYKGLSFFEADGPEGCYFATVINGRLYLSTELHGNFWADEKPILTKEMFLNLIS